MPKTFPSGRRDLGLDCFGANGLLRAPASQRGLPIETRKPSQATEADATATRSPPTFARGRAGQRARSPSGCCAVSGAAARGFSGSCTRLAGGCRLCAMSFARLRVLLLFVPLSYLTRGWGRTERFARYCYSPLSSHLVFPRRMFRPARSSSPLECGERVSGVGGCVSAGVKARSDLLRPRCA